MTINYNWIISKADARTTPLNGLDKVIVSCEWIVTATDGGITLSSYGKTDFQEPDPGNFVDISDVKQSTILGWLFTAIDKDAIEQELAVRIDQQRQPETVAISIPKD